MILNLFILILSLQFTIVQQQDLVKEFHLLDSKKAEEVFISMYNNKSIDAQAYVIALEMKKAEYTILPWKKLDIFNTKKKELNILIAKKPNNIHLRYIRLFLQENTPKVLGYTTYIKEDKQFLIKKLDLKDSSDFMDKYITKYTSL